MNIANQDVYYNDLLDGISTLKYNEDQGNLKKFQNKILVQSLSKLDFTKIDNKVFHKT